MVPTTMTLKMEYEKDGNETTNYVGVGVTNTVVDNMHVLLVQIYIIYWHVRDLTLAQA
jgi:hypothetical protein